MKRIELLNFSVLQNLLFQESNKVNDMNRFGFSHQISNLILLANQIKGQTILHFRTLAIFGRKMHPTWFGSDQGKNSVSRAYRCDLRFTLLHRSLVCWVQLRSLTCNLDDILDSGWTPGFWGVEFFFFNLSHQKVSCVFTFLWTRHC